MIQEFASAFPILTLIAPAKNASENVVCLSHPLTLLTNLSIEANSMYPDQTATLEEQSDLVLHCLSMRFQNI